MKNKPLSAAALGLALLVSLSACAPPEEPAAAADPIIGAWTMTSLEAGGDTVPYAGEIIFTAAGTVSVQAMNPDTAAPDTAYTVGGYEAFYGPVLIDSDDSTFAVDVESAVARDLIGERLTRNYEVTEDTLVLTPTDPDEGWRVTYERQ
jgi:hypothetical protein